MKATYMMLSLVMLVIYGCVSKPSAVTTTPIKYDLNRGPMLSYKVCESDSDCEFTRNSVLFMGECARGCFKKGVNLPKCMPAGIISGGGECKCINEVCKMKSPCDGLNQTACYENPQCTPVGSVLKAFLAEGGEKEEFVFEKCIEKLKKYAGCTEIVRMDENYGGSSYRKECRCCSDRKMGATPIVDEGEPCTLNRECEQIDCSRYNTELKSGYQPACVNGLCKCMCYGCE